ncbi:MAG: type II toxin-antitoxin system Phd/YefM family antitoxin [Comamonadaceae bacterium]|nr:MAG: type II toxin-antitoxin system Phd/YefM family antitoxin [Comamonadaceae bacterium]
MAAATVSEVRRNFADLIETAQHEAVTVESDGEPRAVMISAAEYERLREAADELEDLLAFDASMSEKGANMTWKQVKNRLGR